MDNHQAQEWVNGFLDETPARSREVAAPATRRFAGGIAFSPFVVEHAVQARELSRRLMMAGRDGDMDAVRAAAEDMAADNDPAAVRFALKLFVTHSRLGRQLHITALERRAPVKVVPSTAAGLGAVADGRGEGLLNWWREDPEANEHHDHWHAVYPTAGIADPTDDDPGRTRRLSRQGELFFYMHQQMLARYDHERIAVGLPLVQPLARYDSAIPSGYDSSAGLRGFPNAWWDEARERQDFPTPRPDGAHLAPSIPFDPPLPRSDLTNRHGLLLQAVDSGRILNAAGDYVATDLDILGHATEPSQAPEKLRDLTDVPDTETYGNFHGSGHIFIAYAQGFDRSSGVMADTDTAIRDPVFYRWHRHVDDLAYRWQQRQPPHDLSLHVGDIELRHGRPARAGRPGESIDLILAEETDELAALSESALASRLYGEFGGTHWDTDFAHRQPAADELRTRMLTRTLTLQPAADEVRDIDYLDQRPFVYAIRLRNTRATEHRVTVRVFIVADRLFANRRMWIELDKFMHTVTGDRSIAVRRSSESSVIRKPGHKPPGPTRHSPNRVPSDTGWDADSFCDCGWPYNLLLPRSTRRGLKFWLAAIVTDGQSDSVLTSECGSMSFCGAKDGYPDARSMGYPFDRPISGEAIARALTERPNMAARSFRIRREPDERRAPTTSKQRTSGESR